MFTSKPSWTHTSSAKSSGRRYVATALLGDGPPVWHIATGAEAVDRGLVMRSSDNICSPDAGVQYESPDCRMGPLNSHNDTTHEAVDASLGSWRARI